VNLDQTITEADLTETAVNRRLEPPEGGVYGRDFDVDGMSGGLFHRLVSVLRRLAGRG
jgi:hypothetical protein